MQRWLLGIDVVVVLLFVVLGRETHDEGNALTATLETAAPFLIALAAGWLVTRAWRHPLDLKAGLGVLAVTIVGGMLLRRLVFDEGTATAFVIVATAFLTLGLLGWRLIARALVARRSAATV